MKIMLLVRRHWYSKLMILFFPNLTFIHGLLTRKANCNNNWMSYIARTFCLNIWYNTFIKHCRMPAKYLLITFLKILLQTLLTPSARRSRAARARARPRRPAVSPAGRLGLLGFDQFFFFRRLGGVV